MELSGIPGEISIRNARGEVERVEPIWLRGVWATARSPAWPAGAVDENAWCVIHVPTGVFKDSGPPSAQFR